MLTSVGPLVDIPLRWKTPVSWARSALANVQMLLSDHAYLERKAASNALEMLNRWPAPNRPPEWESTLAGVARDEARHLEQVLRHLRKRGGELARLHKSTYATKLRALVRNGKGPHEIMDRLLVSALIELRSFERFVLLAGACSDGELAKFYQTLAGSEAGHYQVFLALAGHARPKFEVDARWQEMLDAEANIIQKEPSGSGIHSGPPSEN